MKFSYSPAKGLGYGEGACRRDPSDAIKVGEKYYVYYTSVANGFDNQDYSEINKTKIGVAVGDSPDGPWSEPQKNMIFYPFEPFRA